MLGILNVFIWLLCFCLVHFWFLARKLAGYFSRFLLKARFVNTTVGTSVSRSLATRSECLDSFWRLHLFNCWYLEIFWLELILGLSSLFKNFDWNAFVELLLVFNPFPVYFSVFWGRYVYKSKLGFVTHWVHPPLDETLVVVSKCLLGEWIAIRHFEYLAKQVLVLLWQLEGVVRFVGFFLENFFCVVGQFNLIKRLLKNLNLSHTDYFS